MPSQRPVIPFLDPFGFPLQLEHDILVPVFKTLGGNPARLQPAPQYRYADLSQHSASLRECAKS